MYLIYRVRQRVASRIRPSCINIFDRLPKVYIEISSHGVGLVVDCETPRESSGADFLELRVE